MKKLWIVLVVLGTVMYLQGCVSNSENPFPKKSANLKKGEFYIDKGMHYICHTRKDAIGSILTLIRRDLMGGLPYLEKDLCMVVDAKKQVVAKKITSSKNVLDGISVPVYEIRIISIEGRKPEKLWAGNLWMVDALEDYISK